MSRRESGNALLERKRRAPDVLFACMFLLLAVILLAQLFDQTTYTSEARLFAQPRFWPALSLLGMTTFAVFYLADSLLSRRTQNSWQELLLWLRAFEYAAWFMLYATLVPFTGYLATTVMIAVVLSFRVGYRTVKKLSHAAICALIIVLIFKGILKVSLPSGRIYELLPDGLRQMMQAYF